MRMRLAALALLAAACSPAPQSAQTPASAAATAEAPTSVDPYTQALAGAAAEGEWIARSDEGVSSACFGAPESECQITIVCEQPSGAVKLMYEHELTPDQDTTLTVFNATSTLSLPARSFNEGLPSVNVDLTAAAAERLPLISLLGAPTDRFGVQVAGGDLRVFPWNDAIATTLIACR